MNKIAIGCLVQWYEIELVEEYLQSVKNAIDMIDNKKDVIIDLYFNIDETLEKLEKENKSLKNEIKGIYKGFKEYFKDSKQVTTEQVKTLVSGVLDKVKEFVNHTEKRMF